jgi:5-methylcytosine-specific restriction endonuclease McrA
MNSRISARERGLLKGAIRRTFSRSDLRRSCIEASVIPGHSDPSRPKVKMWCRCAVCNKPEAKSYMQADHIIPVIPITSTLEHMSWDAVIDRHWCAPENLQAVCIPCHKLKTKEENKLRREHKKSLQKSDNRAILPKATKLSQPKNKRKTK